MGGGCDIQHLHSGWQPTKKIEYRRGVNSVKIIQWREKEIDKHLSSVCRRSSGLLGGLHILRDECGTFRQGDQPSQLSYFEETGTGQSERHQRVIPHRPTSQVVRKKRGLVSILE